jgi:arylsulfatase A-like enzyme
VALVEVALASAGLATALALLPALGLALLLRARVGAVTPVEALRVLWAQRSARGVVGVTVGALVYGLSLFAVATSHAHAIRTDALRLWAVSLAAAGLVPVGWLCGTAAGRSAERWRFGRALAVPAAALLAAVVVAVRAADTLALLGPDATVAPAAALFGLFAILRVAVRGGAWARRAVVAGAVIALGALPAPRSDAARTALVFDAPCAAALGRLLPALGPLGTGASAQPPAFALAPRSPLRRRWPIVLVTIDSLRPDHVGAYGAARPTTPNLDALARRALVFERAYAPGSSTRFSIPALVTGRFMSQLAMRGRAILPQNETFAEVLGAAGWHAAAVMGPTERGTGPGVGQGFSVFRHSRDLQGEHVDRGIVDEALALLEAAPRDRPLLLWVHLYDPHTPLSPQPDAPRWGDRDADRYDREVWATDRQLGRLLEAVEGRFGPDGAVVVVSADHGEAFGEHGKVGHSAQLYEELVRVPLVVRVPGGAVGRSPMLASLLDLYPTFLDLTGVPHPAVLEGRSLLPLLEGGEPDLERMVFEELRFGRAADHGQTAVHHRRHHLIVDAASGAGVLFDVVRDASEAHPVPLRGRDAATAARLRAAVLGLRARIDGARDDHAAAERP